MPVALGDAERVHLPARTVEEGLIGVAEQIEQRVKSAARVRRGRNGHGASSSTVASDYARR